MRIVFGVCCWISEKQQLPELRRCLESIKDYRVILVDGKWYDMDHPLHYSISEAYDIFDQYPNVEVIVSLNRTEYQARNLYLERCEEDDVLIWIDTDEWLKTDGPFEENITDQPTFLVNFFDTRMGGACWQKRGVRYPTETRHTNRHNQLWRNGVEILGSAAPAPDGLVIHQDKQYRSQSREKAMYTRNHLKRYR